MRLMGCGGKAGLVMSNCISSYSIGQSIEFECSVGNFNCGGQIRHPESDGLAQFEVGDKTDNLLANAYAGSNPALPTISPTDWL